jgi:hypothetical protein
MAKLIGNAPNQVPTNADLGSMAFEDRTNYITKNNPVHQPFRNIIINGDMSIAQRATSATGIGNLDTGYHTCDRWRFAEFGSPTGEFTQSQSTDVPSGQGFASSLKMDCTTADTSLGSSDLFWIEQRFEGQNLQYLKKGTASAESLTLSFWVKSNKTGTYIIELSDSDNYRFFSKAYTINASNTWEKKTITFAGDTTGAFDNDNNTSCRITFWLATGSTWNSGTLSTTWTSTIDANRAVGQVNLADSTSNYINITGVQLEAGTSASDFEFLPYDVNLQRCQRYYYVHATGIQQPIGLAIYYTSSDLRTYISFPTKMRSNPSLEVENITDGYELRRTGGVDRMDDFSVNMYGSQSISILNQSDVTGTQGLGGDLFTNNASSLLAFDAEL